MEDFEYFKNKIIFSTKLFLMDNPNYRKKDKKIKSFFSKSIEPIFCAHSKKLNKVDIFYIHNNRFALFTYFFEDGWLGFWRLNRENLEKYFSYASYVNIIDKLLLYDIAGKYENEKI
jgi:hypothetical protein